MKYRKIKVPNYIFKDELGEFSFHDVDLLVDMDSKITPEKFNQNSDDYSISSLEIEKMAHEAGYRFFNDKYKKVLTGEYSITASEFNGIRLFLHVNGSELSKLLDLDKSNISRIISGKQQIQKNTQILIMEKLKNELETPGITKAIFEKNKNTKKNDFLELKINGAVVAEWFIREFIKLEDYISNLKLQKLLYYAQGIGIGRYNCKLMINDFSAWEHGPVIESIYHKYKGYGSGALVVNPSADISSVTEEKVAMQILLETMNMYGKYSAWKLREKTHCEPPWVETQQNDVIDFKKIQNFFNDLLV